MSYRQLKPDAQAKLGLSSLSSLGPLITRRIHSAGRYEFSRLGANAEEMRVGADIDVAIDEDCPGDRLRSIQFVRGEDFELVPPG